MGVKLRNYLINTVLIMLVMCLFMVFIILCDKYTKNHHKATMAYNDAEASRYRMLTEQYNSENARLRLEFSEAQLNAFIKKYGGGENDNNK